MFKKTETNEQIMQDEQLKTREKIETTLCKLQTLKNEISELRRQCEELKKLRLEDKGKMLLCSECGNTIEPSQEVVFRDSAGTEKHYYHKACFRELLMSHDL